MAAVVASVASAAVGALVSHLVHVRRRKGKGSDSTDITDRSTTSSAGGGAAAYETRKAVDEYIQFHFGDPADVLPYPAGPREALDFPRRCAELAEKHCLALQDFTGERLAPTALDVGCAVGGSSFALASAFEHVLGIDFSQAFVDAARAIGAAGSLPYRTVVEGEITEMRIGRVPEDIDRERVTFQTGDACALSPSLAPVDALVAANLLCRLPRPAAFLADCARLVKPGGVLVLATPASWLAAWTPRELWMGGKVGADGKPMRTVDAVSAALSPAFELVESVDLPFLIREHVRKYQWGCSGVTVWRRRKVVQ